MNQKLTEITEGTRRRQISRMKAGRFSGILLKGSGFFCPNGGGNAKIGRMNSFRGQLGSSIVSSECPVIVRLKGSRKAEFESVASAKVWLKKARQLHRAGAETAQIYIFANGQWSLVK